jgi:hypothetical protein
MELTINLDGVNDSLEYVFAMKSIEEILIDYISLRQL